MCINKWEILDKICYTDLVYGRINKKLKSQLSMAQIEELLFQVIQKTSADDFQRIGKNIYVTNAEKGMRITINRNTFRVITVDEVMKK
ncbi:DUF3781 domain-containing protein [Geofilum rubicundum]|nr:DUF3781 domain-containing protein [Geofilum rubicundum]